MKEVSRLFECLIRGIQHIRYSTMLRELRIERPYVSLLTHRSCPGCGRSSPADEIRTYCKTCNAPVLAHYDLAKGATLVDRDAIRSRQRGLWRWRELLLVRDPSYEVTLGAGDCPLLAASNLGSHLGLAHLFIKDESSNPTQL